MDESYFDAEADAWDDAEKTERAQVVATAIGEAVPLGPSVRVLEYGAGTGLVSQQLAGAVGPMTLADPSAGMRRVALGKVASGVLPTGTRVWDLDLATGDVPEERFDLIVTVMTLHHIEDLAPVLGGFRTLLADGGHLCIVDLEAEDGSFHSNREFHGHHGFDRRELTGQLVAAGFTAGPIERVHHVAKGERTYPLFLAVFTPGRRTTGEVAG